MITLTIKKYQDSSKIEELQFANTKLQDALDFIISKYDGCFNDFHSKRLHHIKAVERDLKLWGHAHLQAKKGKELIAINISQSKGKSAKEKQLESLKKAVRKLQIENYEFSEWSEYISKSSGKSVYLDILAKNLIDDKESQIIKIRLSDHQVGFSHNSNNAELQGHFTSEADIDIRCVKELNKLINDIFKTK
jgi:hypothetical protein